MSRSAHLRLQRRLHLLPRVPHAFALLLACLACLACTVPAPAHGVHGAHGAHADHLAAASAARRDVPWGCARIECTPLRALRWGAMRWGVPFGVLRAVALCESGLNPRAYNASSGASGLAQFLPHTYWAWAPYARERRSYWFASASANVMAWAFAHGHASAWVCARTLGYAL